MKVNVTQTLWDLDGEALPVSNQERQALVQARDLVKAGDVEQALPILEALVGAAEPLTFRTVATNALLLTMKGDDAIDGEKKYALWKLAKQIQESDEPEIDTGKDVALLKERIGKAYGPLVVGPCFLVLNGDQGEAKE